MKIYDIYDYTGKELLHANAPTIFVRSILGGKSAKQVSDAVRKGHRLNGHVIKDVSHRLPDVVTSDLRTKLLNTCSEERTKALKQP